MRIIDCIRRESNVFFTPEKMISSAGDRATNPSVIAPPLLLRRLNLKVYMGTIDGITTKLVFFIDTHRILQTRLQKEPL